MGRIETFHSEKATAARPPAAEIPVPPVLVIFESFCATNLFMEDLAEMTEKLQTQSLAPTFRNKDDVLSAVQSGVA